MDLWTPDLYLRALRFAGERHAGQLVPGSALPYVVHISWVAAEVMHAIAAEHVASPDLAVTCAVLHDLAEDTATSIEEIEEAFGADVGSGVRALTKDEALPAEHRLDDSLARIQRNPREIWIVKMADRIVNLQQPPSDWTREKKERYRNEARRIHTALSPAHAGLGRRLALSTEAYSVWID